MNKINIIITELYRNLENTSLIIVPMLIWAGSTIALEKVNAALAWFLLIFGLLYGIRFMRPIFEKEWKGEQQ